MNYQLKLHGPDPFEYYHYQKETLMKELLFSFKGFSVMEPQKIIASNYWMSLEPKVNIDLV